MTDILFTHGFFLRFDEKQWRAMQPYPPLGTLYACSYLRDNGYSVALHDTMFANSADDIIPALKKHKPRIVVLHEDNFNWLSKMCLTRMRDASQKMMQHVKSVLGPSVVTIVAGSDATDQKELYLESGADFIVVGETEQTLLELIDSIFQKQVRTLDTIPGLAFKQRNEIISTSKRNYLKQLDEMPFPAWDIVDREAYKSRWVGRHGYHSVNLVTTRGCPFKCNWCAKPIYGSRYNCRTPENVVEEIVWLKENWAPDHIWFADDIFGLKPGWVDSFSRLLIEANAEIPFKMQGRVDLLTDAVVQSLEEAGCKTVWVGAESGSQKVLDLMEKGTTVQQIYEATRRLKKYKIEVCFFLQFGYPGETEEDIQKTIEMVRECQPDDIGISVSYPLPGTKFYDNVKTQMQQKQNWEHSDDLAMMFSGAYQPDFYRQLHRVVHHDFRLHQSLNLLSTIWKKPSSYAAALKGILSAGVRAPRLFLARHRLNQMKIRNEFI